MSEPPAESVPSSPPAPRAGFQLPDRAWPWLAFGFPMLLYIYTACRTVYVGDAGDFVVASWTLGMSHPPGYPLYTLLGWVMTHLPIPGGVSEPAFRMNLMSGIFGALTCLYVYKIMAYVGRARSLALLAAIAVAVSRTFWWQSTITEVYTMNTFFIVLQWWLTIRYADTGDRKQWEWLLIAMSVSLAHHYSILMFFPFMFAYIWIRRGRLFPNPPASSLLLESETEALVPTQAGPKSWALADLGQAAILLILPMVTLYLYLPLVNYKTPVSATRTPYSTPAEEFRYAVFETILRGVYNNKAKFENATTTPQVIEHYIKYTIGDPTQSFDRFESGDQGTLTVGLLLALWAAFLWKRKTPEDLPDDLVPDFEGDKLALLNRLFLGCLLLFFLVIILVPSGDILAAPQTNLKVVMPPLLVPGHLYLVLAIFTGALAYWHYLPTYVWLGRAKDPMPPAKKLQLSRNMLVGVCALLVSVNVYNNWPTGDRSGAYISWTYVQDVVKSLEPDTFVMNTGDETFLYWYLEQVHWDLHPEERVEGVEFTNWIHQIPSFEVLQAETEAELQRDIIVYFLKQQIVERAARTLQASSNQGHPIRFATTFFRPEFLQVDFFRYWDVELDGLLYTWTPKSDYEPIIIQDIIQTNQTTAEWDRLGEDSLQILTQYLTVLLYDRSPRFAARVNLDNGSEATSGGAAALADPGELGPIVQTGEGPDAPWIGPEPSPEGPEDPLMLNLSDDQGELLYQVSDLPPLLVNNRVRDWWTFFDWRGVLTVTGSGDDIQVDPPTVAFDAQEEEILARFQDLFIQHAVEHYHRAAVHQTALEALLDSDPESADAKSLEEDFFDEMLEADYYASIAVKMPFVHNPEMSISGWGLLGDIKLTLGQFESAAQAFEYLALKLDPKQYPIEASRARANWAFALRRLGRIRQAEQLVTEALLIDPGNPLATQLQQETDNPGSTQDDALPAFETPFDLNKDRAVPEPETASPPEE